MYCDTYRIPYALKMSITINWIQYHYSKCSHTISMYFSSHIWPFSTGSKSWAFHTSLILSSTPNLILRIRTHTFIISKIVRFNDNLNYSSWSITYLSGGAMFMPIGGPTLHNVLHKSPASPLFLPGYNITQSRRSTDVINCLPRRSRDQSASSCL